MERANADIETMKGVMESWGIHRCELAREAGLTSSYVSKILDGKRSLKDRLCEALANMIEKRKTLVVGILCVVGILV